MISPPSSAESKSSWLPRLTPNFLLVCDFASYSDSKLNMLGVFTEIRPRRLPAQMNQIFVVASFEAPSVLEGTQIPTQVSVTSPTGEVILALPVTVRVGSPPLGRPNIPLTINQVTVIGGFSFGQEGRYQVHLKVGDEEMADTSIWIRSPIEPALLARPATPQVSQL